MLQKISIQNFRSLKNVSLHLQDVNVLIGANNSGKTNFLKALEFLRDFNNYNYGIYLEESFKKVCFKQTNQFSIRIDLNDIDTPSTLAIYQIEFNYNHSINKFDSRTVVGLTNNITTPIFNIGDEKFPHYFTNKELKENDIVLALPKSSKVQALFSSPLPSRTFFLLGDILRGLFLYQPDSSKLTKPYPLTVDKLVNANASNLVAFLDNMRDEFPEVYQNIIRDLRACLEEFMDLRFQKVEPSSDSDERKLYGNQTFKKLGLADKFGNTYWAEELSEGTLYFLALLAIIHQPNPPKLLLLEEPERGIHPRRIKEVMDFIFRLASEKQIQVILTTHSPIVLDCFRDYPEKVFVFDKDEEGATQIKNLETDILIPRGEKEIASGLEPIDYTRSMGAYWEAGFFGGVPKNINPVS